MKLSPNNNFGLKLPNWMEIMNLISLFFKKEKSARISVDFSRTTQGKEQPLRPVKKSPPAYSGKDTEIEIPQPFLEYTKYTGIEIPQYILKELPYRDTSNTDSISNSQAPHSDQNFVERRQYRRIQWKEIQNHEIDARCCNTLTMNMCTATVLDISPGGLLLAPTRPVNVGNELHVNCRLGKRFLLDELVVVKSVNIQNSGVSFVNLKGETESFILGIYGALGYNHPAVVAH